MTHSRMLQLADNFWNIRGSFKIGYVIDVGTHASLVKQKNGKYVFLDSYTLSAAVKAQIDELTDGGEDVEAILNVHPFHTVHVRTMHEMYPHAKLYGTARHVSKFPELSWEQLRTEDEALHSMFAEDFEFSVPRGVDFISANENIHFSSVLVLHRSSKTIHVDDTYMYIRLPFFMRLFGLSGPVSLHPTLAQALEKRAGAAKDFREWAQELTDKWRDAENLCTAHIAPLTKDTNKGASVPDRMATALKKVERTVATHEEKYG